MIARGPSPDAVGFLLDLDPDLGSWLSSKEWEQARRATPVNLVRVPRGAWMLSGHPVDRDDIIGLIVTEGALGREIALSDHHMLELLCRGDVLLLPEPMSDGLRLGGDVKLTGLTEVRLIVLCESFIRAAAQWPSLLTNLHRRLEAQRERLAIQGLTAHLPRADERVLLTLWLLADSCGRVTPDGTVLPLSLTHDVLARLAAARRPTITLALRSLETADCIRRRPDGHLVLTRSAERKVNAITKTSDSGPTVGQSLRLEKLLNQPTADRPVLAR
ncbi:MAG: helix-turn-helix domain-containing protein [Solirubrobacteraceae bacterium]